MSCVMLHLPINDLTTESHERILHRQIELCKVSLAFDRKDGNEKAEASCALHHTSSSLSHASRISITYDD